jgi:T-complex protein 1 subunit eta
MSHMMQPQIVLLREGTDTSQGKGQLISNINACQAVADSIRSTLGPRGMDKLVFDGHAVTISNDGATIMKLLDVVHPAAKMLVDVSMSQDAEVGDGTTSVVLLASEFLKQAKPFIEDGVHPQIIVRAYRRAALKAVARIKEMAIGVDTSDPDGSRKMLERCAATALNSKLISQQQDFFAPMVVKCVLSLDPNDMDIVGMVGVKKVPGGSVTDSFLVDGVGFKKTFSYAGFEQQTKNFENPKVLLLNIELELKSEKENAEIRITDPTQYQSIVDAEWNIIYEKLAKIVESGANIVLSKLPIGDLATQYFADRGLFCAGRVEDGDLQRTAKAVGATIQTTVNNMGEDVLGTCGRFEEQQVGDERFNLFTQCPNARTSTIVLRGGAEQFIEESHRSVHDALMIVKRCIQSQSIVAGGGAIEMEMSMELRKMAMSTEGKAQMVIQAFAKALEVIPRQLADNAGFDATNILNLLRAKHFKEPEAGKWFGVDCSTGGICDTFESHIWEPSANKVNSIASACEAACMILSVDETIRNPASEQQEGGKGKGKGGKGMGLGNLSAAMGGGGMMGMGKGGKGGGLGRGVRAFRGRGGA